jgi:hypothetical protein
MNDIGCDNIYNQNPNRLYCDFTKNTDKLTGAHFDFNEVCKRLNDFLQGKHHPPRCRSRQRLNILATQAIEKINPKEINYSKQPIVKKIMPSKFGMKAYTPHIQLYMPYSKKAPRSSQQSCNFLTHKKMLISPQAFSHRSLDMRKLKDVMNMQNFKISALSMQKMSIDHTRKDIKYTPKMRNHLVQYSSNTIHKQRVCLQ